MIFRLNEEDPAEVAAMNNEIITLTREELYKLVWSEPLTKLSKQLGISDVGLAKICKRLNIPRPEHDHWLRSRKGWPVKVKALLPMHDPSLLRVEIEKREKKEKIQEQQLEQDPLILYERLQENWIQVPLTLHAPHDLVKATAEHARKRDPGRYGRLDLREKERLDIVVSPASLPRALRIMNALIKALERRGMTVSVKPTPDFKTRAFIKGEEVPFGIYEPSKQVPHTLTADEKRRMKEYGHDPSWFQKYDYIPSGKLSLVDKAHWEPVPIVKDTDKKPIEECLNEFIIGLIKAAEVQKADRIEREKRRAADEEARRRREEIERQRREEEERFKTLERQVEAWTKSQQIRAFVEAVRAAAVTARGPIEPGSDLDRWIEWALKQAEQINPIK